MPCQQRPRSVTGMFAHRAVRPRYTPGMRRHLLPVVLFTLLGCSVLLMGLAVYGLLR